MKCTGCGEALHAAAYTIDLLLGDDHSTINLHQNCLRGMVGDRAISAINAMLLKSGWTQLALPTDEQQRA